MSDTESYTESGLTRRELLKKGAVLGGALVWAAPVVQVIGMRPALAQETSPTCPNLYCVKAEWNEDTMTLEGFTACSAGHAQGRGNCLVPPADVNPTVPSEILGAIVVTQDSDCPGGILVTLPPGCHLAGIDNLTGSPDAFVGGVSAAAKCGRKGGRFANPCFPPTSVGEDSQGNTTLCFSIECPNGTSISHIELLFCCG